MWAHSSYTFRYQAKTIRSESKTVGLNFCFAQTQCATVWSNTEKAPKLPAARNSDGVLKLRKEKVEEWESTLDLDFTETACLLAKQD